MVPTFPRLCLRLNAITPPLVTLASIPPTRKKHPLILDKLPTKLKFPDLPKNLTCFSWTIGLLPLPPGADTMTLLSPTLLPGAPLVGGAEATTLPLLIQVTTLLKSPVPPDSPPLLPPPRPLVCWVSSPPLPLCPLVETDPVTHPHPPSHKKSRGHRHNILRPR